MVRCRASRARQGETPPMKLWRSLIAWLPWTHRSQTTQQTENETPPEVGGRSLRLRLLFWIIIWLMPAAIVSVVQGLDRIQRDVSDVGERLVQTARSSAADEENVLASGEQVLRALALDVGWLDVLLHSRSIPAGAVLAVFDPEGTMVAANDPEAAEKIFFQPTQTSKDNEVFSAAANGEKWSYVLVPLLNNATKVGFAMRNSDLFASTYLHVTTDLLLPVLMLGLASAAIWIFADRQITRWIVYLRRIATAYARGHYAIRPVALEEAPSEFRTLGGTFSAMALALLV